MGRARMRRDEKKEEQKMEVVTKQTKGIEKE
eukprot:CAMPEP_0201492984 /NCGR_PEP_ID=MMETSP0151_2-20130828/35646_1 /ASSEMBLY_ACC=CAM_ASM_000257 /TAXON_ID=200890 /ORGANISM="Paramoeba atlantica, Strain 621/1 / CCAP 1560/9" /LENGTH=30 /DNA_ID= /DNA_START= /DNA_END= /DNA_ORIENTATION=